MTIGINPLVDFAFKLMLGSPGHERVTIHFLNAVLSENAKITSVELQNPIVGPAFENDKWVVLDILATDEQGRKFNIEMQTSIPIGLRQRLAFYDSRLYASQMREGDQYHELRPAIVICVLSKPLLLDGEDLHTDFRLRDKTGLPLTDDLQIHLLELTKLKKTRENIANGTPAENWAFFLINAATMTVKEVRELFSAPEFVEAAGVLEVIKDNPEQLDNYISRMKYEKDAAWRLEAGRIAARAEGLAEGRAEGLAEGRAEGRIEGRAEGLAEGLAQGRAEAGKAAELIGRIITVQEILGVQTHSHDQLWTLALPELTQLAEQLRSQVLARMDRGK